MPRIAFTPLCAGIGSGLNRAEFSPFHDLDGGDSLPQAIVALDDKTLRRALDKDQSVQYIVNAWAESKGLVLGQLEVAGKSNGITAVPELLRALELAGCIVTLDAMSWLKKLAREIVEADAD